MSTQSGHRGPSLPVSPSQGLPTRSPPPQDHIYPNPPYDDVATYGDHGPHPNNDQFGAQAAHQYWNEPTAYSSISYNAPDSFHYHQPPHSQAYFQQCERPKESLIHDL